MKIKINDNVYRNLVQFKEGIRDSVVFIDKHDALFVICHGAKNGTVQIDGSLISPSDLLQSFINNHVASMGVRCIKTLSCYGGYQKSTTIDGLTISPLIEHKGELDLNVYASLDGDFYLIVNEL